MFGEVHRELSTMPDDIEHKWQAQNDLHKALSRYVNGAISSRGDVLRATLSPASVLSRHGREVVQMFHAWQERFALSAGITTNIEVEMYRGKNSHVHRMREYCERHLKSDIVGAYVHGSLGTYEEIPYSDFDALVILKTEVLESPERLVDVAAKLCCAKPIMYGFDPLQHHGWFVLTEDDLSCHCEAYFPLELFRYAKSLIAGSGRYLSITARDSQREIDEAHETLTASVIGAIARGRLPANVYQLKCLTSEFMLLPALYAQRKRKAGIFKKFSFEEARRDFTDDDWRIMDEVSTLRQEWNYSLQGWQRRIATNGHVLRNYLIWRCAPAIPHHLKARLSPEFYSRMHRLAFLMRNRFVEPRSD